MNDPSTWGSSSSRLRSGLSPSPGCKELKAFSTITWSNKPWISSCTGVCVTQLPKVVEAPISETLIVARILVAPTRWGITRVILLICCIIFSHFIIYVRQEQIGYKGNHKKKNSKEIKFLLSLIKDNLLGLFPLDTH